MKGRKDPQCEEGPELVCEEGAVVHRRLHPTEQKIYWFLKNATSDGGERLAIRDTDMIKVINCTQRTLYLSNKMLKSRGMIDIELLSIKGRARSMPRKVYTFIGVPEDECVLIKQQSNFSY